MDKGVMPLCAPMGYEHLRVATNAILNIIYNKTPEKTLDTIRQDP